MLRNPGLLVATGIVINLMFTAQSRALITYDTKYIGNLGNAADATGFGSVNYGYGIGTFEVTAGQYTQFLNSVAATDTFRLYSPSMASGPHRTRIQRTGSSGNYSYSVESGFEDRPVNFVSVADTYRFANWMHNGQPNGLQNTSTTEDGSYLLNGAWDNDAAIFSVTRKPDATWVLPTVDEWYKAAYHKNDGVTANYWDFPIRSNQYPQNDLNFDQIEDDSIPDEGNTATLYDVYTSIPANSGFTLLIDRVGSYNNWVGSRTKVGEHEYSTSAYGNFDMSGNVVEWTETPGAGAQSGSMMAFGGGYAQNTVTPVPSGEVPGSLLDPSEAGYMQGAQAPTSQILDWGFRLVDLTRAPDPELPPRPIWQVGQPIVGHWVADTLTEGIAQHTSAAGFNIAWINRSDVVGQNEMVSQLDIAQAHGMRGIVHSYLLTPATIANGGANLGKLDGLIDEMKNHPAAYAYFIADEPKATDFSGLASLKSYIQERDPDRLLYVNLSPNNFPISEYGGPSSYQEYLNEFIDTVDPDLISYDNYQFLTTGDHSSYFPNLATIANTSKAHDLPFMNVVQAVSISDSSSSFERRLPNESELRFLAYTTLAYGGKGISYFNYSRFDGDDGGIEPYPDQTNTAVYTALQTINPEFEAVAAEVQPLDSIGAFHLGDQPNGTVRLPANSPFTLSPSISDTNYVDQGINSAPVEGVLVGLFGAGDQVTDAKLALVVNLDYENAFSTTVTGPGALSLFDATSGEWTSTGQAMALLNIAPGGGILVGLTAFLSGIPGDYDGNGTVGPEDYTKWKAEFGDNVSPGTGADGNYDGIVNAADYTIWRNHFGNSASGQGQAHSTQVPEPNSIVLLSLGALLALVRRWKRS